MKLLKECPYQYGEFSSEDTANGRFYDCNGQKLPSVTTVLSGTKDEDKQKTLDNWIKRVGEEEANRIRNEAASRGSHMHYILENIIGHGDAWQYTPTTAEEKIAFKMANTIKLNAFPRIQEVYGLEIPLYYPEKYAGRADVIGVFEGEPAIMDFKQTNKPKRREWVGDYFCQLSAYALAHNELYGTDIKKGVVLMCSVDMIYQEFIVEKEEFEAYAKLWLNRVERYHSAKNPEASSSD